MIYNMVCERCGGRGWIANPSIGWADPCNHCGGLGRYRVRYLSRLLGVPESTFRRFIGKSATKVATCQLILDRLVELRAI